MRAGFLALVLSLPALAETPLDAARKLMEEKKYGEAADALEKLAAGDEKDTEALRLLLTARAEEKNWEGYVDALVRLGKRGVAFETTAGLATQVQEQLNLVYWYATPAQKIVIYGRLSQEFPKSPWRLGWLSALLVAHAKEKHPEEIEEVEKLLFATPPDMMGCYRIGRSYLEAGLKPEKALELLTSAVDQRTKLPLPEDPLARETALTEISTWRSYLAFALRSCGRNGPGNPFHDAEPDSSSFTDVTSDAGLSAAASGRVAVGDFDGDGWDDLSFQGAVWKNDKGVFRFANKEVGLPEALAGSSSLWADADNDGDLDLWVFAKERACRLFVQDAGKFTEATGTGLGKALESGPEGAGLGDGNGDGFLDAYLAVYEAGDLGGGRPDAYFQSLGRLEWTESLEAAGMGAEVATPMAGRGVNWGDFDNDGDPDIFVSNYRLNPNWLWRNAGKGAFADAAAELGARGRGVPTEGTIYYGHTIGSTWADLDNDGDLDLVSSNLAHPRFIKFSNKTQVLMNQGADAGWTFADIFPWSGIPYEETHSDVSACDYDNDGDLDLYFTGVYRERPSWLVRNNGAAHFESVSWKSGTVVFDGWGHAWLDYDNDGDEDLLVCAHGKPTLFRNDLPAGQGWLQVELKGKTNGTAIGARVQVFLGDSAQIREIAAGRGTSCQDSMRAHFGFGKRTGDAPVVVRWPDGGGARVEKVKLNQRLRLTQGE